MLTKVRNRLAQEEGFTLIELLVVILIIGILAAVAIPTFLSQKNKANDSNAQSNLKNAQTVVEAYASGNAGNYPAASTLTAINSVAGLTSDSDATALGSGSQPVYFTTGSSTSSQSDSYALCAEGSDNSTDHLWWIVESGGTTTYYETTGSGSGCAGQTVPTTGGSVSQFPPITTS